MKPDKYTVLQPQIIINDLLLTCEANGTEPTQNNLKKLYHELRQVHYIDAMHEINQFLKTSNLKRS